MVAQVATFRYNQSAVTPDSYVAFAYTEVNAANQFLLKLGQAAANLVPPVINANFPAGPAAPPVVLPPPPTTATIVWSAPALPQPFADQLSVDSIIPAAFTDLAPVPLYGTAPALVTDPIPSAPGITIPADIPDLTISLPSPPALLSLNIGTFGGINMPTLDPTIPTLTLDAPSIREYIPGQGYTSGLLTSLRTRLQNTLDNGGTGFNPAVEQAFYDRLREKEARSRSDSLKDLDKMEFLGFMLPPGIYLDARLRITTESDFVNRGSAREIMIKAAELEQENIKIALGSAVTIEGTLISYTNNVEQRLFDSCKFATEAGISIYNARVQAYIAFLDAFKARVAIYEAQVRGELAKVEVYKAQLEAERTKADINKTLVEQFKVQIDAALSAVEIYKARIGAIQSKVEIEKLKIQVFGEQVKAYGTQVGAYTAGVEGYRATIQAEGAKQDAYKSRVQAYTAQVEAATKVIEAKVKVYEGRIAGKSAEYDGYKAAISAESARVGAIADTNKSIADVYRATVQADASYNEVLTKQWDATITQAAKIADVSIATAKANAELYITSRTQVIEAAKVGATVCAQLGAAALNAIHFSNSNSYSESASKSDSTSDSASSNKSESSSLSQSTNYNYSL